MNRILARLGLAPDLLRKRRLVPLVLDVQPPRARAETDDRVALALHPVVVVELGALAGDGVEEDVWRGRDGGDVDAGWGGEGEEAGVQGGAEAEGDGGVEGGERGGAFLREDEVLGAGGFAGGSEGLGHGGRTGGVDGSALRRGMEGLVY